MNFVLALLLQLQTSTKSFCERHLIADDFAPYAEMTNLELVRFHMLHSSDGAQQELRFRVSTGMIEAVEISDMKKQIEGEQ